MPMIALQSKQRLALRADEPLGDRGHAVGQHVDPAGAGREDAVAWRAGDGQRLAVGRDRVDDELDHALVKGQAVRLVAAARIRLGCQARDAQLEQVDDDLRGRRAGGQRDRESEFGAVAELGGRLDDRRPGHRHVRRCAVSELDSTTEHAREMYSTRYSVPYGLLEVVGKTSWALSEVFDHRWRRALFGFLRGQGIQASTRRTIQRP